MCIYTDKVVDFIDLFMHFTVHSDLKCLVIYAEGYGACSSRCSRLPMLFSLYSVLHSNCGVIPLSLCHMYQISIKDGAKTYSCFCFLLLLVVMFCVSLLAVEIIKQFKNEWNEV